MGYRIVYGPDMTVCKPQSENRSRIAVMTAVFLLLFMLLVRQYWPAGTQVLKQYLLPGELTVTEQAFQSMMDELRSGEQAGAAFTAFCQEIVHNGKTAN